METVELYGRTYPRHPIMRRSKLTPMTRYKRIVEALVVARDTCSMGERAVHWEITKVLAKAQAALDSMGDNQRADIAPLPWEAKVERPIENPKAWSPF